MNARKTISIAAALVSALSFTFAAAAGPGNHAASLKLAQPVKGGLVLSVKIDGEAAKAAKITIVPLGSAKPELALTDAAGIVRASLNPGVYLIKLADEPAAKPVLVKISPALTTSASLEVEGEGGYCGNPPFGNPQPQADPSDAGSMKATEK